MLAKKTGRGKRLRAKWGGGGVFCLIWLVDDAGYWVGTAFIADYESLTKIDSLDGKTRRVVRSSFEHAVSMRYGRTWPKALLEVLAETQWAKSMGHSQAAEERVEQARDERAMGQQVGYAGGPGAAVMSSGDMLLDDFPPSFTFD